MTIHLNVLNLSLQGRQNISHLVGHIEAFRKKLQLFIMCLRENDLSHFASCREVLVEDDIEAVFSSFVRKIQTLSSEFEKRFRD
jgi:hypothetical protein